MNKSSGQSKEDWGANLRDDNSLITMYRYTNARFDIEQYSVKHILNEILNAFW